MKQLTREWIEKAEADARAATILHESGATVYDAICFHAHECVEKYLKAWLTEQEQPFPRTHDLEVLATLCLRRIPDLASFMADLNLLTGFGVEVRYPGSSAEQDDADGVLRWRTRFEY